MNISFTSFYACFQCLLSMPFSMPYFNALFQCLISMPFFTTLFRSLPSMLSFNACFQWLLSMPSFNSFFQYCVSISSFNAFFQCLLSMFTFNAIFYALFQCLISMSCLIAFFQSLLSMLFSWTNFPRNFNQGYFLSPRNLPLHFTSFLWTFVSMFFRSFPSGFSSSPLSSPLRPKVSLPFAYILLSCGFFLHWHKKFKDIVRNASKEALLSSYSIFSAWRDAPCSLTILALNKSLCRSVRRSIGPSVTLYFFWRGDL